MRTLHVQETSIVEGGISSHTVTGIFSGAEAITGIALLTVAAIAFNTISRATDGSSSFANGMAIIVNSSAVFIGVVCSTAGLVLTTDASVRLYDLISEDL